MSDVDALVAWLSGVLEDVDAAAMPCTGEQPWTAVGDWDTAAVEDCQGRVVVRGRSEADTVHIAVNDPRAVRARVAAEKRLVEAYEAGDLDPLVLGDVLRWLAYGHRHDSPGYRTEWAPHGVTADA